MEIHLLRHGIAEERAAHGGPDDERALTAEGRRKVRSVAKAMRAMRLSFDVIFSSPLVRALQTAEIVAESLRLKRRLQLTEHLGSGATTEKQIAWLKSLRPAPGSVLLVGHEPNFSELTSRLLTGHERLAINFKKAGFCKVTAERPGAELATLEWLLTPKQMERMK
jgi:phosphohistidine phosphatase